MKPLAHERASANDTRSTRPDRIDAVVVCSDDSLLIELGPVLGDRYRTHTVDSPADIAGRVDATRWIGIIDVDSLSEARAALARLEAQFANCPLIVVAARPEEWAAAVTRGSVLAALGRQEVSGVRLAEALAVAETRLQATEPADDARPARSLSARPSAPSDRSLLGIGLGVVVLAAAATGLWWHHGHAKQPGASSSAAPATGAATPSPSGPAVLASAPAAAATAAPSPRSVLELLSAARVAFHDQKLLLPGLEGEPHGDSALELYTQVLQQDPGNDEALDGIRRLFEVGTQRINADLASGRLDDANRLVGMFAAAGVNHDAVQSLQQSITAARPKWLQQRVQQNLAAGDLASAGQLIGQLTASGTEPTVVAALRRALEARKLELQLQALAAQVHSAIQSGALLDPANDNARVRLEAMRSLARSQPLTLAAQRDLQAALLARVAQAAHAAEFDEAQRYLNAAASLGTGNALSDARRALQSAQARAVQHSAAAARAQAAATVRAAAALPAATAPPARPPARKPSYIAARPRGALGVSYPTGETAQGTLIVEFTLSANGRASDAQVVQSSLPDRFNPVAIGAVLRGRYSTAELSDGHPRRARILLRFVPN